MRSSTSRLPTSWCSSARSQAARCSAAAAASCVERNGSSSWPGPRAFPRLPLTDVQRVIANAVLWARVDSRRRWTPRHASSRRQAGPEAGMTSFRFAVVGAGRSRGSGFRSSGIARMWTWSRGRRRLRGRACSGRARRSVRAVLRHAGESSRSNIAHVVVNLTPPARHRPVVETRSTSMPRLRREADRDDARGRAGAVRAAERAGRTCAVMQHRRFEHGRTLRDGLAAGRIGSVTTFACDFLRRRISRLPGGNGEPAPPRHGHPPV